VALRNDEVQYTMTIALGAQRVRLGGLVNDE
jgi:hypothetical protein